MSWRRKLLHHQYRDVSAFFQWIRQFLLGRRHTVHGRFAPTLSPRSIPKPEIPRGPEIKFSNHYYYNRHSYDSMHPPVVAPIAEGPAIGHDQYEPVTPGGLRPDYLDFPCLPMPGRPYWWDDHNFFMCIPDSPDPPAFYVPCPPVCKDEPPPRPPPKSTCPPGNPPCPKPPEEERYPPPCPRP